MTGSSIRKPPEHASFSDEFGNALEYGWGPILISVLFSAALALPDPSHEALMSVAENALRSPVGLVAAICTVAAFFFLPPTLHLFTRFALETPRPPGPHRKQIEAVLLTWVGRLPLLAVVVAVLRVLAGEDDVSTSAQILLALMAAAAGIFAASGVWVFLPPELRERFWPRIDRAVARAPGRPLPRLYVLIRDAGTANQKRAALVCAAVMAILALRPQLSVWLGPIAVAILFVMLAAICLAILTRLSSRLSYGQIPLVFLALGMVMAGTGRPGTVIFLILAAIYAFTVFVHPARTTRPERLTGALVLMLAIGMVVWGQVKRKECPALAGCHLLQPAEVTAPVMATAYRQWRDAAPASQPTRLIAAEGGGIFAAYYTALYLAKRADTEGPDFARSVFAISGVSGGSVGAAAFWAILRSGICSEAGAAADCHQQKARQILSRDFLSPVMVGMFTTDLFDKIIPYSSAMTATRLERARQLEVALIDGGRTALGQTAGLDDTLANGWAADAGLPALFLNATRVRDGQRLILSPFAQMGGEAMDWPNAQMTGAGLPVATAAFTSARFPLVTAAARLTGPEGIEQIVDGGYFDNSGIETISDILEAISPGGADRIEVVALTNAPPPRDRDDRLRGAIGTPMSAFLGAWRSRLEMVAQRMTARWTQPGPASLQVFRLPLTDVNYTVSWYLDRNSFCGIERNLNTKLQPTATTQDDPRLTSPCD